ncbi:trimethylamine methyltransferase family protein [Desulforhopalus singaporensis]|uniref:Trimethylamine---corrinoid protein Co-methyltransferase n=1 Tax=Desulforhopalus singaporensis TaxID=91360 RepID=A0A1H0KG50_9BACT|nr:trimethylamine methyltransferase family protein [Desulforhopalus singaporensis]SDO54958.1 trimethylamine---corrinoid protein Co-methyltransferase [Desulforhopalus singaporensis]
MLKLDLISLKQQEELHEKSLYLLEKTGVAFNYKPALELLEKHGATIDGNIARIPPGLVTRCLETCPASFTLSARNQSRDVRFGDNDTFIVLPNLGPVFIRETDGKKRRGTMDDFVNITKLSHASSVIDVVGSCPIDAHDVDNDTKFLAMLHQSFRHSDKPVMCCTAAPHLVDRQLQLMEIAFEQPSILREKTVTGTSLSPLSPLGYSEDACHAIMAFGGLRQMVIIAGAPMSGISAPVSISGTTLMINCEFLAGMVLAQCAGPGAPVVYATTASAGNLTNATYVTGIPETTLLNIFAAQMGAYYNVPTRSVGTATEAKLVDMQSGYEAMQNLLMTALGGTDAIYETLGTLDSLMTVSYEKFMIDQELLSRVKTIVGGVNETSGDLMLEDVEQQGIGGNYLCTRATFSACRQRWNPTVSTWCSHDKWMENGSRSVEDKAALLWHQTLENAPAAILNQQTDRDIAAFITKS